MREHLIGYLLNAVEPEERAMVEEQLKHDEALRREMELLRSGLHPLACDASRHPAPRAWPSAAASTFSLGWS